MKKAYPIIAAICFILFPFLHFYFFRQFGWIHFAFVAAGMFIITVLIIVQKPPELKDLADVEGQKFFGEKKKRTFKQKLVFYLVVFLVLCIIYFLLQKQITGFVQSNPWILSTFDHMKDEIATKTLLGLLYVSFLGALFFLSFPLEIVFFFYHQAGHPGLYLVLICTLGSLAGFVFNYVFGFLVGKKVMSLFFKENYEKMKHIFEKFGGFVLVFGNIIPFPIEVVVMIAGAMRYSFKRFLLYSFVGKIIKFTLLFILHGYITETVIPFFNSLI